MRAFLYSLMEAFAVAGGALKANRSRAILTTLGIVIGIMAVATTMTVSNGLGNNFKESISAVGSDVLYVSRMPWIVTGNFFQFRNRKPISYRQSQDLSANMETAVAVCPSAGTQKNIKFGSKVLENIIIVGTTDKQMMVASAREEVERLQRTVLELLDLSRIEAGRAELQVQSVDVRALCRRAADAAGAAVKEVRIQRDREKAKAALRSAGFLGQFKGRTVRSGFGVPDDVKPAAPEAVKASRSIAEAVRKAPNDPAARWHGGFAPSLFADHLRRQRLARRVAPHLPGPRMLRFASWIR